MTEVRTRTGRTIEEDAVLACGECGNNFDRNGQPYVGSSSGRQMYAWVCDACKPAWDAQQHQLAQARARLPVPLRDLQFDESPDPATEAARQWGRGEIQGVLLCGPVGTGKTHLAACAVNERLRHERVRWVSFPSLIARSLAAFDSAERKAATEELTGSTSIVLDDLDKVKASDWVLSQLFVAIDTRVTAGAGLFVTTNLGPGELAGRFGEAIASRLAGHCVVRKLDGADRRLQKKAA